MTQIIAKLTVRLLTGSTESMTLKYALMANKLCVLNDFTLKILILHISVISDQTGNQIFKSASTGSGNRKFQYG